MKNNILKTKIILSVCLLLASVAAQAVDGLLQGVWKVEQVTIEKNTDGKVQTTVYNMAAEVQNHIPCLQELEINAQTAVLRYPDGGEEPAEYTLGSDLTIYTVVGQLYRYSIKDENLILTVAYNYVNNDLLAKQTENITEKWVITLKK